MRRWTDIIWPSLERESPKTIAGFKQKEDDDVAAITSCAWGDEPAQAFEEARRIADSEEDRIKTADGKATNYLLFCGALIPLLTYLEPTIADGAQGRLPVWVISAMLILAVLYLLGAGYWSFRTMKVRTFFRLDSADLVTAWTQPDREAALLREVLLAGRRSRDAVNDKVTCTIMAHSFLTRAFFVLGLLLVLKGGDAIVDALPCVCGPWA